MTTPSFPAAPDALPEVLEPLRFPLHGSRLIEASAGTGKTFTIAALAGALAGAVIVQGVIVAFYTLTARSLAIPLPFVICLLYTSDAADE